jgi:hypothetical protein
MKGAKSDVHDRGHQGTPGGRAVLERESQGSKQTSDKAVGADVHQSTPQGKMVGAVAEGESGGRDNSQRQGMHSLPEGDCGRCRFEGRWEGFSTIPHANPLLPR